MRALVYTLLACLALPAAASADYRYDNHWTVTPKLAEQTLRQHGQQFTGPETGNRWQRINYVHCKGDPSHAYDVNRARGLYHHLWCAASLRGNSRVFATFDLWWVGDSNYRTSDIDFQAYA